ncbi:transporter substrate-binding domain-containing protein [Azospirillum sp. RWY-5-1]|uniref:Transporter substrate-binding domain-containing protein n=1 Tax=Azospirillum oleiclasticum TaxID=2735135 RepID=A0ABX2TC36_9PROT|nr:transporter substrate-binding domain-containing protein [Azospirillum oleiclasticum]NYZ14128.1 transporter substrate-binding domain-containing protein [Azospirillum oleiclasticum]NYZ21612.1 transporter substrate-binding domain-containing protein [Azospirillum oleiclasticum]
MVAGGSFPPFTVLDGDGRMTGVYPDALASIGRELDWTFQYMAVPWARAQDMVRTAQADGFITVPTPERQNYALFAKQPLVSGLGMVIVHAVDSPRRSEIERIASYDDLRPFALVDYIGNGWGNAIWESWPTVERVRDLRTLVRMIATGRADIALQPRSVVEAVARQAGFEGQIVFHAATFAERSTSGVHFGLRRNFPGAEASMALYEEVQARFIARRGVDDLMERWS